MSPHRRTPRPMALAFDALRDELAPATLLAEVQRLWPEVVGRAISVQARPVREHAGVLTVSCAASVWAQELELMSETILEALNARLQGARPPGGARITRLRCVAADLSTGGR